MKAPAPIPWTTRNPMSICMLVAVPHSSEAAVKMATHAKNRRLRPN